LTGTIANSTHWVGTSKLIDTQSLAVLRDHLTIPLLGLVSAWSTAADSGGGVGKKKGEDEEDKEEVTRIAKVRKGFLGRQH
jgi:hypothetical protein